MVSGPLSYYKGDIPEDNLDEILATKTTLDSLTDNKYSNRDNALITNVKVNVRRISTPNPYSRYNFYREEPVSDGLTFLQYHKKELLAYPFVFQVTPIGVVIYSKWGEEASDAIFDNVKPL